MFTFALMWMLQGAIAVPSLPRFPADVDDVHALTANPAGLGFLPGADLRLAYGRRDARDGLGVLGGVRLVESLHSAFSVGVRYSYDRGPNETEQQRLSLGAGFRLDQFSFGLSWDRTWPFSGDRKSVVSLGFQHRIWSWLSMGALVRDVAQHADRRRYDLGLALRPFGDRFLASGRWRLRQSQPVNKDTLDVAVRLAYEPVDGLLLGVETNQDLDVSGHVMFTFGRWSLSALASQFGPGSSFGSELAFYSDLKPALFPVPKLVLIELDGTLETAPRLNLVRRAFEVDRYGSAVLALEAVSTSEQVAGVVVRIQELPIGWGKAEELRRGIKKIIHSGRRVDCQLLGSDDLAYYVASACTSIIVPPALMLEIDGLSAEVLFFRSGLERLGVRVFVERRGRFKSAPEAFTHQEMSAPHREALTHYVDEVYQSLVRGVSEGRSLASEAVEAVVREGTMTATQARARGFVDHLLYDDQLEKHLAKMYGGAVHWASAGAPLNPMRASWSGRPRIAVIHVDAPITGGESRVLPMALGQTAGAKTIMEALGLAKRDPSIRAVVLRVDTPGGDALASDVIARAVQELDAVKPVIASFGDLAASGGYYVAAPTRRIFAEATTLTGSIGVFSLGVSLEGLMERLGVSMSEVRRGPLAGRGSWRRDPSPLEQEATRRGVDAAYAQFLRVVARGRGQSVAAVREVAEGRIWSGRAALERGVVDELGGLVQAIAWAKKEAGIEAQERVEVIVLPGDPLQVPAPIRTLASARDSDSTGDFHHLGSLLGGVGRWAPVFLGLSRVGGFGRRGLALLPFLLQID